MKLDAVLSGLGLKLNLGALTLDKVAHVLLLILVAAATWIIPAGSYDYVDGVPVAKAVSGRGCVA